MDVIHVPAPPKEAFYKLRPMSDLIKHQVSHFKHLEEKLPAEQRKALPQHRITTENDAALYIAAMTKLLRSGQSGGAERKPVALRKPARPKSIEGLQIAASAGDVPKPATSKPSAKRNKKK